MSFIFSEEVQHRSGYHRVTIWRKARDPKDDFPAPLQLSPNRIAWDEDEYGEWERTRPRVSYAPEQSSTDIAIETASVAAPIPHQRK